MPAGEVYAALWRRRMIIVLLTIMAGIAAFVWSQTQPTIYQADALVRIQQRAASPDDVFGSVGSLELGERLAQTYAQIVETRSMTQRVGNALSGDVPRGEISISASPVGNVELLRVSAQSEDPQAAAVVANATTAALRRFIAETGTLRDQIVVVDRATAPDFPILPTTKRNVAIAILLALIFNCALALGLEFFADRLPEMDQWEDRFGRPVLATVPTLNLKPPGAVLRALPDLPEPTPLPVTSTQAVAGPTRWSVAGPEVRRRQGSG
jgi:capsular polysaccharide biosynthesis protein